MAITRGLWAGALVAMIVLAGACSSGGVGAFDGPTTRGPSTDPAGSVGSSGPSAAAQNAVGGVAITTSGTNCGGGPLDRGWPTTFAMAGNPSTCLRDASRQGRAAYMNYTGRTYTKGAYRIALSVAGAGPMRVVVVTAAASGSLQRATWTCPVPQQPIAMTVTFPSNGVLPGVVNARCRVIAS
jgi:hypothetical protein